MTSTRTTRHPERGGTSCCPSRPTGHCSSRRSAATFDDVCTWWRVRAHHSSVRTVTLDNPECLSRFTIHQQVVPTLRVGRVFLAGDAAHILSSVGAQGMNTGIQDAVNLGWKRALVVQGQAHQTLLDTYAAERLPVARAVLRTTSALTKAITLRSRPLLAIRNRVMSMLIGTPAMQDRLLHLAASLGVTYRATHRGSSLSPFAPSRLGERLPTCSFRTVGAPLIRRAMSPGLHAAAVRPAESHGPA
ncbi:hypothetical protein E7T06_05850 [Deinococcus sp. Arct2-2]|uniref:FAD-dependent monooxygenase n=1 Tax=Deinococcus sp. Arct2-2 TaxID=2568653 RepID=UPI0010A36B8E|nr:hypothetical protein E7T06_05850 [Deinococcus sp. Arct2-2]